MNDLTIIGRGVASFTAGVGPFEACFQPARPALDAVVALRKPLAWMGQYRRPLLDVARASQHLDQAIERCVMIPKEPEICRARKLFEQAEREPAPIEWVHIAIALMLDSEPGAQLISDGYRHSVIDAMFEDPETWGDYGPGYSAPVIIRAIREARRQGGLPPSEKFVALCGRNREWFRRGQTHIDDLIRIRQNAEDVLINLGDNRVADLCRHAGTSAIKPSARARKKGPDDDPLLKGARLSARSPKSGYNPIERPDRACERLIPDRPWWRRRYCARQLGNGGDQFAPLHRQVELSIQRRRSDKLRRAPGASALSARLQAIVFCIGEAEREAAVAWVVWCFVIRPRSPKALPKTTRPGHPTTDWVVRMLDAAQVLLPLFHPSVLTHPTPVKTTQPKAMGLGDLGCPLGCPGYPTGHCARS